MAVFKCKMCGGTIEFEQGASVGVCDSCGTKQTLPRLDDDRRANLYDRANHFRRNNEFDKAAAIYEQILTEDTTDAEAYWSLVLCQYGIEYVEDPATHKRVPTVNRAQFTSIFDDDNYKSALQYADGYQRELYEKEAKTINDIQKGILAISQKEDPFDVFICYKETDNNGRRTPDSVLANDLYYQLKQEGFKVFFARITLEDKLGTAYEPYIFAALNSAKVMVVLGTKPEYFNAVWVKNEWSRYLSLVKTSGGKKVLIPAYRDMDPYDLPDEFSHLQAQDMSKLGFMQDLIRGIKKIATADEPKATIKETVVVESGNANVAPLLERAFLFLEDEKWQDANFYCEKVLDIDPKNAEAYLGKLMANLQVRTRKQLADCAEPFDDRENYGKVIRFGDEKLEAEMRGYIAHINERNENERMARIYNGAVNAMNAANSEVVFKATAERFKMISGFKDADSLAKECLEKAEVCRKNAIYASAHNEQIKNSIAGCESAIRLYESISGWKDADEQIYACRKKIEEIKAKEEADRLERKRQAEQRRIAAEKAKKKLKKFFLIATPVAIGIVACILLTIFLIIPTIKYNNAISLMEKGNYAEAKTILADLNGFRTSNNKIVITDAVKLAEDGDYDAAIKAVLSVSEPINIKYSLNGGESDTGDKFHYANLSEYSSLLTPKKEGYRFVEWSLTEYSYSKDDSLQLFFEAVWYDGYSITYKLDGGTANNPDGYHKDGKAITLSNPTKKGYTFTGWTGTDLTGLTMIVTIPAGSYGDREFVANWKANKYTVSLNANGGTTSTSSISTIYDSSYSLPVPTRDYYTFAGWYNGTKKYTSGTWDVASDTTLTAQWTPVSYSITYNLSGGSNSAQNVKNYTIESAAIVLKDPARTGYQFEGWYKDDAYSEKVTEIAAGSHENISFYAKWKIINYTITYILNNGTISGTPKTTFTVNDLPISLPTPQKSGLVFINWSKSTYDGAVVAQITSVGDITLVASYMDPNLKLVSSGSYYSYYTVSSYASSGSATVLDIPAYYKGLPVKEIANGAFKENTTLVTINIPSTVTKIGSLDYSSYSDGVFYSCKNLKNINIPYGVTYISDATFYECDSLTSISIPDSVRTIGKSAFRYSGLESISLPNSVTSIDAGAFGGCRKLSSISLPTTLTRIGKFAFQGCESLKSISIPKSVSQIEVQTFMGCTNLETVVLQEGLNSIDAGAFNECKSLKKIIIPKSVTKIYGASSSYNLIVFYYCNNLTIYCRTTVIPDGWGKGWNKTFFSYAPVVWGYTGN